MTDPLSNSTTRVSILIADTHDIFLAGLARIVRRFSFVSQITVARNGEELISLLSHSDFHLILLDSCLPPFCTVDLLQKINRQKPHLKIIIMGLKNDTAMAWRLLQTGINGYILKSISEHNLSIAMQTVLHNKSYLCREVEVAINSSNWHNRISQCIGEKFFYKSERIREMLFLITREFTSKEIAMRMDISEKTVEKYRAQLIKITGAKNVVGLAMYAFSQNIHTDSELEQKHRLQTI